MSETWRRRFLYVAGGWNILGGISALADPTRHFASLYSRAMSLDDPLHAFFYRATWINVIAWRIGYVLAARHPQARGPVLLAGGTGKLAYFGACLVLFSSGIGSTMLLASGMLDVIFAIFFVYVVWVQRREAV